MGNGGVGTGGKKKFGEKWRGSTSVTCFTGFCFLLLLSVVYRESISKSLLSIVLNIVFLFLFSRTSSALRAAPPLNLSST